MYNLDKWMDGLIVFLGIVILCVGGRPSKNTVGDNNMLLLILCLGFGWVVGLAVICLLVRQRLQKRKGVQDRTEDRISIGLFHPYCNAGSGRERVLWVALKCLQTRYPSFQFIIYTGDTDAAPEEILARTCQRFNIVVPFPVEFVYLHKRKWVEASSYPYFTLLGQSLGSIYLGFEALFKFVPDVYIDTSGYTFTLPLFKYFGNCRVGCYVHTPLLTTDMLHRVSSMTFRDFPRPVPSPYSLNAMLQLVYHKILAKFYGWAGHASNIVMVNSSWTEEQINQIWQCPSNTHRVFPPCDTKGFKKYVTEKKKMKEGIPPPIKIISIGQFRPEKDHPLQIRTLYQLREMLHEKEWNRVSLVLIGTIRDKADLARVKDMEDLCKHLSVEDNVKFRVNISYNELQAEMEDGLIGLHTAWNEQFGIGIVESMSAGLIMVANRSGGPMMDIVMEYDGARNGFLATDENDYAEAIRDIIHMTPEYHDAIKSQAVASVDRFSERQFNKTFLEAVESSLFC